MNSIKQNTKKYSKEIVASAITISVVILLILAGPANAFNLNLNNFPSNPTQGTSVSSYFTISVKSNERISMPSKVGIFLEGSSSSICSFSVADGSSSDCVSKGKQ